MQVMVRNELLERRGRGELGGSQGGCWHLRGQGPERPPFLQGRAKVWLDRTLQLGSQSAWCSRQPPAHLKTAGTSSWEEAAGLLQCKPNWLSHGPGYEGGACTLPHPFSSSHVLSCSLHPAALAFHESSPWRGGGSQGHSQLLLLAAQGCSKNQDEAWAGQHWAVWPSPGVPACVGLRGWASRREICCTAPGCAQGKVAGMRLPVGMAGTRFWGPRAMSPGLGMEAASPPHSAVSARGRASVPMPSLDGATHPGSPCCPRGRAEGGLWLCRGVGAGASRAVATQLPPPLGRHLLASSVSVSGSPAAGWGLGCTACTVSSRLPLGNTT